jgi:hypothetical protein
MARSIAQIKSQMIDAKNQELALQGLTSTSQTAVWNLILFITAGAINILEQLMDLFKSDIESQISHAIPNTPQWLQQQAFKFQYDANNPQVLELVDLIPTYPIINTNLQLLTRCSVSNGNNKEVNIRVAKQNPPEKLITAERIALMSYFNVLGNAGITYNIISIDPDLIEIDADVFYDAQYSAVIQSAINTALYSYLSSIDFNGYIYVTKIEDTIQAISGVKDIKINNIYVRASYETYANKHIIYSLSTGTNARYYQPYAGYIVEETTTSHTFNDTINYFAQ